MAATTLESPGQYERDLRSASTPWKRGKDASAKWSHGSRPLHGCTLDANTLEAKGGSEAQRAKSRPQRMESAYRGRHTERHNIIKFTRGNYEQPARLVRTTMSAHEELVDAPASRSIADLLPSPGKTSAAADRVLYSFDNTDSPGRPLTLDVFVKAATGRDTERLVEREYEVVDENGHALTGRRARRNLRKADGAPSPSSMAATEVAATEDDDGFELV